MLSNRPYLIRAFYQWIIDNNCTPILVVANHPTCRIPQNYVEDNEIVFNISPTAVRDLKIGNDRIEFKASFSGVIHVISAPINALLSIYAEENGEGLFFDNEDEAESDNDDNRLSGPASVSSVYSDDMEPEVPIAPAPRSKPFLKLVE
jgi:stringent starvation protein B